LLAGAAAGGGDEGPASDMMCAASVERCKRVVEQSDLHEDYGLQCADAQESEINRGHVRALQTGGQLSRSRPETSLATSAIWIVRMARPHEAGVVRINAMSYPSLDIWLLGCAYSESTLVSDATHMRWCFSLSLLSHSEPLSQLSVRLQRLLWHVFSWETRG
jgi:hypothetical protein